MKINLPTGVIKGLVHGIGRMTVEKEKEVEPPKAIENNIQHTLDIKDWEITWLYDFLIKNEELMNNGLEYETTNDTFYRNLRRMKQKSILRQIMLKREKKFGYPFPKCLIKDPMYQENGSNGSSDKNSNDDVSDDNSDKISEKMEKAKIKLANALPIKNPKEAILELVKKTKINRQKMMQNYSPTTVFLFI